MRNPSIKTLKAAVTRLTNQLDAMSKTLANVAEERDTAVRQEKMYKGWWLDADSARKTNEAGRRRYEQERDAALGQAAEARKGEANAVADRDRERGYIEGLLDGRYPERPRLPWEEGEVISTMSSVGDIYHEERRR
jgi:hypothetical protein